MSKEVGWQAFAPQLPPRLLRWMVPSEPGEGKGRDGREKVDDERDSKLMPEGRVQDGGSGSGSSARCGSTLRAVVWEGESRQNHRISC